MEESSVPTYEGLLFFQEHYYADHTGNRTGSTSNGILHKNIPERLAKVPVSLPEYVVNLTYHRKVVKVMLLWYVRSVFSSVILKEP